MKYTLVSLFNFSAYVEHFKITNDQFQITSFITDKGLVVILDFESDNDMLSKDADHIKLNLQTIMNQALPTINRELLIKKYLDAHLLIDTISILDIIEIGIKNEKQEKTIAFKKQFIIGRFPSLVAETNIDEIFIRDYIDSMTSYYKYNLDDCIRKAITSLENYFDYLGITGNGDHLSFKNGKYATFMSKQNLCSCSK